MLVVESKESPVLMKAVLREKVGELFSEPDSKIQQPQNF